MIKVSSAENEPFSMTIEYKDHSIILVGLQDENGYEGDLKVFKEDEDVSDNIGDYDISGEGLKKILDKIDTF
tara:strand:+ start:1206 stop:1421 length:216 start_codon:yes stop_codon:yes gene_type:complete